MNIIAISGSLRKDSFNTMLLRSLQSIAPANTYITILDISNIPLFNQDAEADFPSSIQVLKDAVLAADGIIIATPEYNRSVPGVLKNVIDWISRPYGQNSFAGKPVLTMGVSVGKIGTAIAQSHLRQIMVHLDTQIIGQPELYLGPAEEMFDSVGNLVDGPTKDLLVQALKVLNTRCA